MDKYSGMNKVQVKLSVKKPEKVRKSFMDKFAAAAGIMLIAALVAVFAFIKSSGGWIYAAIETLTGI